MQTTRYLLLGISILGWAEVLLAEPGWKDIVSAATNVGGGSLQPDPKPAANPGYQAEAGIEVGVGGSQPDPEPATIPDPSKIAEIVKYGLSLGENSKPDIPESKPEPDTKAPPIVFDVTMNEMWTLSLTENYITLTPGPDTKGVQSGGPFGALVYFIEKIIFIIKKQPDGTFEAYALVTYSNSKYSFEESYNHPNCKSIIKAPIDGKGTVDSPNLKEMQAKLKKIKKPGDSTLIHSGSAVSWFDNYHNNIPYYYYNTSVYDEKTDKSYNCATMIELSMIADANYASVDQLSSMMEKVKDSSGNPKEDNSPPKAKKLSGTKQGVGVQVKPV